LRFVTAETGGLLRRRHPSRILYPSMMRAGAGRTLRRLSLFAMVFTALRVYSFTAASATFDEPAHLAAGYAALAAGDYRVDPTHPPLLRMWAALPLLAMPVVPPDLRAIDRADPAAWLRQTTPFTRDYLYRGNDADRLLYAGRAMIVVWGVVLGVLVFFWTRELFGDVAAAIALVAYTISPNLAAHARLVTTDFGEACFFFGAVYFLWRFCRPADVPLPLARRRKSRAPTAPPPSPSARAGRRDLAAAALCAALAVVTKFSGVVLAPVLLLLLVVAVVRSRLTLARAAAVAGTFAVAAFVVIWATYGFRYAPSDTPGWLFHLDANPVVQQHPGALFSAAAWIDAHHLLPNAFVEGFVYSQASARMLPSFLAGEVSAHGWWYYFPLAYALKTPLAILVLLAAGLIAYAKRRRELGATTLVFLIGPAAVFLAVAMTSQINLGVRHILPVYPFAIVAVAAGARELMATAGRSGAIAVAALIALGGAEVARVYPNTLTFFNAAVGGPDGGAEYLTDSNIDWGQHLKRLKRWMDRHGVRHVNLAYFGSAVPSYYGIDRTDLPGSALARRVTPKPQLPGYVAISRTVLSGVYLPRRWRYYYRGFQDLQPVAEIGHTIRVYWVETWPEPPTPITSEGDAAVVRRLSDELIRAQAYRHAARHYRDYLRYRPRDAVALGNLGVALASSGDDPGALDAFRRAVSAAPGDVRARNNLTVALLDAGRTGEALENAREAVALAPQDAGAQALLRQASASPRNELTQARAR
jgi:4-amino-4-deoxy-L-arabinose transferase-like glycosyltransferase